ncbi:MAG: prepilin-type N-terminal cleavage/methylation domain-containing protein [Candidatus Riflebacteria bacterium]|nr:prepilin-type N-terminal cleavage/methylation domain-containing protein [Candidatus Riflebacteria bacterium]
MYIRQIHNRKAYTLIEVMISATIISLFFLGIFSLYRLGSRAFASGSWRHSTQKKAERFFANLRTRADQVAAIAYIQNRELHKMEPRFSFADQSVAFRIPTAPPPSAGTPPVPIITKLEPLMFFVVPKQPAADFATGGRKGLLLFCALEFLPPAQNSRFGKIVFKTSDLFNSSFAATFPQYDPNDILSGTLFSNAQDFQPAFSGQPADFGLPPQPQIQELEDIESVRMTVNMYPDNHGRTEAHSFTATFDFVFRHPKFANISLEFSTTVKMPSVRDFSPSAGGAIK